MMRLKCPWCGARDEREFVCRGESGSVRPPLGASDREWVEYLYFRENVKGKHRERWLHVRGCRRWFNVVRDTATHRVLATYELGTPASHFERDQLRMSRRVP